MKKQIANAIQIYLSIEKERQTTRTQMLFYVFASRVIGPSLSGTCNIYYNIVKEKIDTKFPTEYFYFISGSLEGHNMSHEVLTLSTVYSALKCTYCLILSKSQVKNLLLEN